MRYKTRELFDALQTDDEIAFAEANSKWDANCATYSEALKSIRHKLPDSLRDFCDTSLHDGVVLAFTNIGESTFSIDIDASNNPWGPTQTFRLVFGGVNAIELDELAPGDCWLYEETHLSENAAFEYRIMFDSTDVTISANTFELIELDSDNNAA